MTEEDVDTQMQLQTALRSCDESEACRLLRGGASATRKNEKGRTPLDTAAVAAAASKKGLKCFREVFKLAIDIEKKNHESEAAKTWDKAVGGLEANTEHKVELEKIQELSSVQ